jgi:hypothetical protein
LIHPVLSHQVQQDRLAELPATGLDRTSNGAQEPKTQTSNSRQKFTCRRITGTESVLAQAKALRTGANVPIFTETTTTRASISDRLPLNPNRSVVGMIGPPGNRGNRVRTVFYKPAHCDALGLAINDALPEMVVDHRPG